MFKAMLGFIIGVILLYFSGDLINSSKYSLNLYVSLQFVLCFFGVILFCAFVAKVRFLFNLVTFLFFLVIGFSYALDSAEQIKNARITSEYDNKNLLLKGYLCSLPRKGQYSFSADFCIVELRADDGKLIDGAGFKAKLRWPLIVTIPEGLQLFYVKSRQPKSTVNFIGTPYEMRLFYDRIILMGQIKELVGSEAASQLDTLCWLRYHYHQIRQLLKNYSDSLLEDSSQQGVISALLIGDKSGLTGESYKVLANTGTQHLIAISGLHVGLVMFGIYWFLPKARLSIFIVTGFGLFYVLLVGFTPSAQRAWLMCLCALLYLSGYLKVGKWRVFIFALCLVLLVDPLSTLNLGFWYSFLCVAILFLISQTLSIESRPLLALICLQLILILGMIPVSSMLGTKHGLENILANGLSIPWVSLLVLPLTLLWFITSLFSDSLALALLSALNTSIELMMSYLSSLSVINIPLSVSVHGLVIVCFYVCFIVLVLFNKMKTICGLCLVGLSLVICFPSKLDKKDTEFMVFDVGQGLALAFKSGKYIWIYDTGPAFSKMSSTEQVILPYLRRYQKTNASYGLIISHGDADHAGDVESLYDYATPIISWTSQPDRLVVKGFEFCQQGMKWKNYDLQIEVLYPFSNTDLSTVSSNNHSCVVRFTMQGKVFLLMGDLETQAELDFVSYYRDELKANVLIAGHHGAAKSSSYALLKHVQPEYVVFSSGYMNKFGHPSTAVLKRASQFKMKRYDTAYSGALLFNLEPNSNRLVLRTAREDNFWLIP